MKRTLAMVVACSFLSTSCNQAESVVEDFTLEVGENAVTVAAEFSDSFALDLNGVIDIRIKGKDYGEVFLYGASNSTPFTAGLTADLTIFEPENWDGFTPTTTLPNGQPLPGWITPLELISIDIPVSSADYDLTAYVGYKSPYYLGVAVDLNLLDDHFPEGLSLSQYFRKSAEIWSEVVAYGPTKNDKGEVVTHGGLFFVATFDPLMPILLNLENGSARGQWQARGKNADFYNQNPKQLKKLLKSVQEAVEEFNQRNQNIN